MSSAFRAHRVLAVVVLVAAGAWVATGKFAAVGSEEVSAAEAGTGAAQDPALAAVAVELGEWVQAGAPIATILALDPIIVKAEVSERDVASVSVGPNAVVRLVTGVQMQGQVQHVANQASVETRTFVIEVALPNPDHAIPSGMTAEVSLYAAPQTAVVVPRSVITLSEEGLIGLRVVGDFKNPPVHKDGAYMWLVGKAIRHPVIVLFLAVGTLVAVPMTYAQIGKGVEFFPNVDRYFRLW